MSLKDIAEECNTSVSTVSRVLNSKDYHCKNRQLEGKIWDAARRLNYIPNPEARKLQSSAKRTAPKTNYADIFFTRFQVNESDSFFNEIFAYIREELLSFNHYIGNVFNLSDINRRLENPEQYKNQSINTKELIILGKCPNELIPFLKRQYKNIIGIDRNPTDFEYDEVCCDGKTAATKAVDYLVSLEHKKIAYIGDCSFESRYIGYYQALISHKLPLDYGYIYPTNHTKLEGKRAMESLLSKESLPTAVLCANDYTALGVLEALKYKRKKHPVSVISIDNIRQSQNTNPPLTTIDIPKQEIAHHTVLLLMDRKNKGHKNNVRIELPCKLVIRDSCYLCSE